MIDRKKYMEFKELPSKEILMDTAMRMLSMAWNINTIHAAGIERWLDNFHGEALYNDEISLARARDLEQRIALFLLCNFVYYNEEEVRYLLKLMLDKYIHLFFDDEMYGIIKEQNIASLIENTRFSPLGNQSESSSFMLYLFRQVNELSKNDFDETKACNTIVFVDDFSITGTQAEWYIKEYLRKRDDAKEKRIYILLMIATEEAIAKIRKIPYITDVIACVTMDETSKAFSDSSILFQKYNPRIKEQAKKICLHYGDKIISDVDRKDGATALGYGNGAYLMGAYYNTPNNTLPIFWSEEKQWKPIFKRYNKKYIAQMKVRSGSYV